jgi:type IV secretory pathway VirB3-like protein
MEIEYRPRETPMYSALSEKRQYLGLPRPFVILPVVMATLMTVFTGWMLWAALAVGAILMARLIIADDPDVINIYQGYALEGDRYLPWVLPAQSRKLSLRKPGRGLGGLV